MLKWVKPLEMKAIVGGIVGLAVGGLIAAALIPAALQEVIATNTTSWTGNYSALPALWSLLGIFLIVGVVIIVIMYAVSFF